MTAAAVAGEVCGVCAAPLRTAARFCGRCGAAHGRMIPREQGVGPDESSAIAPVAAAPALSFGRGLVVALAAYFAFLVPVLVILTGPALPSRGKLLALDIVTALVGVVGLAALGRPGLATLVPRRWPLRDLALALVATAAIGAIASYIIRLDPWLFIDVNEVLVDPRWSLTATLVHVALVQAITQELAFRGTILTGLRAVLSDRSAVIASALVFGIAHLSVPSLPHLTAFGLVLGWTRLRTGSVWPCVLLHAAYGAATVLLTR